MSVGTPGIHMDRHEAREMQRDWGWFVALGGMLLVAGIIVLSSPFTAALNVAATIGWALAILGVIQAVHAYENREHGGFWASLMGAVLKLVVGGIVIANPAGSAVAVVMMGSAYLLAIGLYRTFAALEVRFPRWQWAAVSGVLSFILGLVMLSQWPMNGLWLLGVFIGTDLIVDGLAFMMLGLRARDLVEERNER